MSLTVIDLVQPGERVDGLGYCVSCDRHPATTLVLDDRESPILGDTDGASGAEFGVCDLCAEVAFPNLPRLVVPLQRKPSECHELPTFDGS